MKDATLLGALVVLVFLLIMFRQTAFVVVQSIVPGYKGACSPVWLNRNQVCRMLDGGVSGYFKNVRRVPWWPWPLKHGPEFHGLIRTDCLVHSTRLKGFDDD